MQVYIMRHGQAEMLAKSDAARPLTRHGRHESEQMAKWLNIQLTGLGASLCSPYLRAQQTLDAVQPFLPEAGIVEEMDALIPSGDVNKVANRIYELAHSGTQSVLIVSHLPLVGYLVEALSPEHTAPIFATSGIACIDIDSELQGTLRFLEGPHSLF